MPEAAFSFSPLHLGDVTGSRPFARKSLLEFAGETFLFSLFLSLLSQSFKCTPIIIAVWRLNFQLIILQNWYCLSKTLAEKEALAYADKHGLDVVTVCPSMVFGPLLQSTVNASSLFLVNILKGVSVIVIVLNC